MIDRAYIRAVKGRWEGQEGFLSIPPNVLWSGGNYILATVHGDGGYGPVPFGSPTVTSWAISFWAQGKGIEWQEDDWAYHPHPVYLPTVWTRIDSESLVLSESPRVLPSPPEELPLFEGLDLDDDFLPLDPALQKPPAK